MKRTSKRRKISCDKITADSKAPQKPSLICCICCKKHTSNMLRELSATIGTVDGQGSCTIAAVIEELACVKLRPAPQTICEVCWSNVHAAHSTQRKIRLSKHLLLCKADEHGNRAGVEHSNLFNTTSSTTTTSTAATMEIVKFEVLSDDSSTIRLEYQSESEYECEYLDEYLEANRSDDHTYGNRLEEEQEEGIKNTHANSNLLGDPSTTNEETQLNDPPYSRAHVTRQFEMPRTMFIQRHELHNQYRLLAVSGERCCGCSYVAENRRELLRHSETVHAIEITDIGDYCPICFFKFATNRQLERHIQEFKSSTIYVCLQCNNFYNIRQKLYNHLLKCGESIDETSVNETEGEEEENEGTDGEDYAKMIEDSIDRTESHSKMSVNDSQTEAYQQKMLRYRPRFDEIMSNDEVFFCELDETGLNIQESQIEAQCSFETFKYVRLRGERCCGCSFTCSTREQLIQHGKISHASIFISWHQPSPAIDDHTCSLCGTQFHDEREIVKHLSFFTSKELFFCTICNASFLNRETLKYHQGQNERHRESKTAAQIQFIELDLPDVLEQLDKLQAEKKTNRSRGIRYIPMPEARFIKNVAEHKNYCVLTVSGERCCGCGKFFDTVADLKQHSIQEHTLPFGSSWISEHLQCEICFAVFDFERGLTMHRAMRRNKTTTLFNCKFCGLLFTKKFCLARHMQSAPNHLSQLIVDATTSSNRKSEADGEQVDAPVENIYESLESDPRVTEALELHKSVQEAGLEKVGYFVGFHCCFSKCAYTFSTEEELLEHSREEHSGKRRENEYERKSDKNICAGCCKSFQNLAKLSWHRFQRFVPRKYNCKHCDKSFDKWPKWKLHEETEHRANPPCYVCTFCNKSFILFSRLKVHMKIHSANKEFTCDICGDKFNSNGMMKRHRRSVHSTELLFECKLCPKRFAVIEKLQIHQRVHTGEKPFECSYCPRAFSHYTDRKRHEMAAHTGERPYKCPHCSAAYIRNRELSLHMRKHKNMQHLQKVVEQQE